MTPLRLATRGSRLARHQAATVAALLPRAPPGLRCEMVVVSTRGDRHRDIPSEAIPGGPGVFTKEADDAVLEGRADAAVHSAKDLPTSLSPGLVIAAVPERVDPRDALVGCALDDLPEGGVVATDSVRRRAQLLWRRPDLRFTLLRGNVETRLRKLEDAGMHSIVLAMAGLDRLSLCGRPDVHPLDPSVMMPAMGQGALAVEARADDDRTVELLAAIDVEELSRGVAAERAATRTLRGGCEAATGALARDGRLEVMAASPDGRSLLRREGPLADAEGIARRLLDDGARSWLAS